MNWLNAIPEADRAEIRKNLFASEEFRRATVNAMAEAFSLSVFGPAWPPADFPAETMKFWGEVEAAVTRVLERHGFKQPHSATSVAHNIMAENTERDRHAARMLALSMLIAEAKLAANVAYQRDNPMDMERKNKLLHAILATEREFRP